MLNPVPKLAENRPIFGLCFADFALLRNILHRLLHPFRQHFVNSTVLRTQSEGPARLPPLPDPPLPTSRPASHSPGWHAKKNERLLIGPRKRGRMGGAICFANRSANARGCQDLRAGCIGWLSRISLPLCSGCCRRWAAAWRWRRAAGCGRTHRYMSRSDADSAGRT